MARRAHLLRWIPLSTAFTLLVAMGACDGRDPPTTRPPLGFFDDDGGGGSGGGIFEPPEACTPPVGACGHQVSQVVLDAPNIYFVIDRSGSMSDPATPGSSTSRHAAVRTAARDMIDSLGALINVGAAVFPGANGGSCAAGYQVMEMSPGDPKSADGTKGPTTIAFEAATFATPNGGTPISSTLYNLLGDLETIDGNTVMILLTDGGPNCNPTASCTIDECQPVVEGTCPADTNCCASSYPNGGPVLCIDRTETVNAVAAVAELGIDVYVVGIPGTEVYEDVLNEMAVAGNTAQTSGDTQFHQVTDLAAVGDVFGQIAADAISCQLPLAQTPTEEDKTFTNVYLDCELLPFDPVNGWGWLEDDTVWLHGAACDALKNGDVREVHIAVGCPTELPK